MVRRCRGGFGWLWFGFLVEFVPEFEVVGFEDLDGLFALLVVHLGDVECFCLVHLFGEPLIG